MSDARTLRWRYRLSRKTSPSVLVGGEQLHHNTLHDEGWAAGTAGSREILVPLFAPDGGETEKVLAAPALYLRHLLQAAVVPFLS